MSSDPVTIDLLEEVRFSFIVSFRTIEAIAALPLVRSSWGGRRALRIAMAFRNGEETTGGLHCMSSACTVVC
jgi:hypothetical protein